MIIANFFRNCSFGGIPSGGISPGFSSAQQPGEEKNTTGGNSRVGRN